MPISVLQCLFVQLQQSSLLLRKKGTLELCNVRHITQPFLKLNNVCIVATLYQKKNKSNQKPICLHPINPYTFPGWTSSHID